MSGILLLCLLAWLVTWAALPWCARLAHRFDFLDRPGARKSQEVPIPMLGGVALLAGILLPYWVQFYGRFPTRFGAGLLGAVLVFSIGLADDRWSLSSGVRLIGQTIAACIPLAFGVSLVPSLDPAINIPLTLLWAVGLTNSINLLDNMDGLASGVCAAISCGLLVIAYTSGLYLVSGAAAAMLGASVGFLRYNFPPAKMYMGDTGAYLLGYVLALGTMDLKFPSTEPYREFIVPVLLLGVPLFDTTLVVFSRLQRGIHPFSGGRDHVSHRLVESGRSVRTAVLTLYAISLTQVVLAVGAAFGSSAVSQTIFAAWLVGFVALLVLVLKRERATMKGGP